MKIGVVGCGQVGSAAAYACVLQGVGTEIVLYDKSTEFAEAQAEDILHATPFSSGVRVRSGDINDLEGAGIVMIAAGVAQKNDSETRLDLLRRNAELFETLVPLILKQAPEATLLIASNPVDIMTHMTAQIAHKECGHPKAKVIGSGTMLDTARYRALLASHLGISSHSIHGYVLGEHGDSEVLQWSGTTIGNIPLANFAAQVGAPITSNIRKTIDDGVRRAAYRIIKGKGATWYGIGAGMARLAEAIIENQNVVLTCCTPLGRVEGISDVTLSLPQIISSNGIEHTLYPELNDQEQEALRQSAEVIKTAIDKI